MFFIVYYNYILSLRQLRRLRALRCMETDL